MPSEPTPAAIAARLSPAQRAMLWAIEKFYRNDVYKTKGKAAVGNYAGWGRCMALADHGLCTLDESEMPIFPNRATGIGFVALTPLGLRVRAALEQEGKGDE